MTRCHLSYQIAILMSTLLLSTATLAQDRHFPLNHRLPTGTAGRWAVATQPQRFGHYQPVKIQLPSAGHVTFFQGNSQNAVLTQSPAQAGMVVGHTYRVRVSGMPEYPGVELFPTIEILDRLHPPEGHANEFPIPIEITAEEIEVVRQDRMVTKVVYLEQPDLAAPVEQGERIRIEDLAASRNLLKAADQRGRPMAIIRIGGRLPDPNSELDVFYSQSPIEIPQQ